MIRNFRRFRRFYESLDSSIVDTVCSKYLDIEITSRESLAGILVNLEVDVFDSGYRPVIVQDYEDVSVDQFITDFELDQGVVSLKKADSKYYLELDIEDETETLGYLKFVPIDNEVDHD